MYVYYGTNEYNFEKLDKLPDYKPTLCHRCGQIIVLGEGGYSQCGNKYWCTKCKLSHFC